MENNNSKLTWQQEEALEREKDRRKLFKGNQYPDGADPDHIWAAENFFRKFHIGAQIIAGSIFINGCLDSSLFGRAIIMSAGLIFISKWVCRWAARKGVEFLMK